MSTLPHGSSGGALEHRRENRYAPAAAYPSDRTLPSLEANAFGSGEIKPLRGMADALSTASRLVLRIVYRGSLRCQIP